MLFLNAVFVVVILGVISVCIRYYAKQNVQIKDEYSRPVVQTGLSQPSTSHPYVKRNRSLYTPAELRFSEALLNAMAGRYAVHGKVRIGDLAKPANGLDKSQSASARNSIDRKHVDFVICDLKTMDILGVVELDDSSHNQPDRIERDALVDHVMQSAGIPILHVPVSSGYNVQTLQSQLQQTLGLQLALASPERVDFAGNRAA